MNNLPVLELHILRLLLVMGSFVGFLNTNLDFNASFSKKIIILDQNKIHIILESYAYA